MCNIQKHLEWTTYTYGEELNLSLIQALVRVDRSNKKSWNAMNFESTHKVSPTPEVCCCCCWFFQLLLESVLFSLYLGFSSREELIQQMVN